MEKQRNRLNDKNTRTVWITSGERWRGRKIYIFIYEKKKNISLKQNAHTKICSRGDGDGDCTIHITSFDIFFFICLYIFLFYFFYAIQPPHAIRKSRIIYFFFVTRALFPDLKKEKKIKIFLSLFFWCGLNKLFSWKKNNSYYGESVFISVWFANIISTEKQKTINRLVL